jgi:hypothetical protein
MTEPLDDGRELLEVTNRHFAVFDEYRQARKEAYLESLVKASEGLPANVRGVHDVYAMRADAWIRGEKQPPLSEHLVGHIQGAYIDRKGRIRMIPAGRIRQFLMRLRAKRIYW